MSYTILSFLKHSIIILLITFGILFTITLILDNFFNFKEFHTGDTDCKVYNKELDFHFYKTSCRLFIKNFEQKEGVLYEFNKFGRRELVSEKHKPKLAFVGDSFTLGAMVPIEKNYNFRAINYYMNSKYTIHNYGVGGEQFHNILNKLTNLDISKYDGVIYGITPNDFFDLVDESDPFFKKVLDNNVSSSKKSYINKFKQIILSTTISRVISHWIFKNDKFYYQVYLKRTPYSGYLYSPLSKKYKNALQIFSARLNKIPKSLKDKLLIFLLPQRAETVAFRLGKYNEDFKNYFLLICKNVEIRCGYSKIKNLALTQNSHFVIDGHLTTEGNDIVARDIAQFLEHKGF